MIGSAQHAQQRQWSVVWVQMCLAAATTLASFRTLTSTILGKLFSRRFARWISRGATAVVVIAIVVLSLSRSIALVVNYGAPMRLYSQLPQVSHYKNNDLLEKNKIIKVIVLHWWLICNKGGQHLLSAYCVIVSDWCFVYRCSHMHGAQCHAQNLWQVCCEYRQHCMCMVVRMALRIETPTVTCKLTAHMTCIANMLCYHASTPFWTACFVLVSACCYSHVCMQCQASSMLSRVCFATWQHVECSCYKLVCQFVRAAGRYAISRDIHIYDKYDMSY